MLAGCWSQCRTLIPRQHRWGLLVQVAEAAELLLGRFIDLLGAATPVLDLRYAVAGKKQIDALGSGTVMDISDSLTPGLLAEGIRTMAWASRLTEMPVPFHTMISNVPGPPTALFLGEAELVVPIGLGPIRDNMGLFHIVSSSETMMSLSFSACKKLIPDAEFYQQCLHNAFASLLGRALSEA